MVTPAGSTWAEVGRPPHGQHPVRSGGPGRSRGRRLLETGRCTTTDELAGAEKINASYVSRILRLTLLAPDIVEAILGGRQAPESTLPVLMGAFPVAWIEQEATLDWRIRRDYLHAE